MSIGKVVRESNRTLIWVVEPTHFGEPDRSRTVVVPHDPTFRSQLPTITREALNHPRDEYYEWEEMETVEIDSIGTLVFVNVHEYFQGGMYRSGAHDVHGPFLLID